MASATDFESEMDSLVASFGNLVCNTKSELPIVVYRKFDKFTTYIDGCDESMDMDIDMIDNGIVSYYSQL